MDQNNNDSAMQASIQRIVDALNELRSDQKEMSKTLTINTVSLQEHMRRTALLEEANTRSNARMEPVISHVNTVNLVLKMAAGALTITGVIIGILSGLKAAGLI